MLGCLDTNHVLKRMGYHLATSGRVVMLGGYAVELAALLRGGLPARAYASCDQQSDRECAQKFNPGYLTSFPLENGALLAMTLQSLFRAAWTSSEEHSALDLSGFQPFIVCNVYQLG